MVFMQLNYTNRISQVVIFVACHLAANINSLLFFGSGLTHEMARGKCRVGGVSRVDL